MSFDPASLPALSEIRAEKCRRSFSAFVRWCWPSIETDTLVESFMLDAIADHLQALGTLDIKRLIINMPPRCGKSNLCTVLWPAWMWLRRPEWRCINNSYAADLAVEHAGKTRRLMDKDAFKVLNQREDGSPVFRLPGSSRDLSRLKDTNEFFENDRGGTRRAIGIGGAFTGKGGHCLIIDDPQNPKQAYSDAERLNTLNWWTRTAASRLDQPRTGQILVVMQRLHYQDLTGFILDNEPGAYTHLKLPMRYKPASKCVTVLSGRPYEDPRTAEGESLQPERFDEPVLAELEKKSGPYDWSGQFQQEPVPEGGGTFRLSWFKRWTQLPIFDVVALSVDAAFGVSATSDYVVLQVWGFRGPDAFLLDQARARLDFVATEQAIVDVMAKHAVMAHGKPTALIIERKANGEALIARLKTRFGGIVPDRDGRPGVVPRESKEARAMAVTPLIAGGNVFLPDDAPWVGDFLIEAVNFPRYTHDDQVDAMTQVLAWRNMSKAEVDRAGGLEKWRVWSKVRQL